MIIMAVFKGVKQYLSGGFGILRNNEKGGQIKLCHMRMKHSGKDIRMC